MSQQNAVKQERAVLSKKTYQALADPDKIVWVDPKDIGHKLAGKLDRILHLGDIAGGDWDLTRIEYERSVKYVSIVQRFQDGVAWKDTTMFRGNYSRRFARGEVILGAGTIEELLCYYERNIDPLYESMKAHGFLLQYNSSGIDYNVVPHAHIARDGTILYGTRGNHRLSIAKLLNLDAIACQIRARHEAWQVVREKVASDGGCGRGEVSEELLHHPDLRDVLHPSGASDSADSPPQPDEAEVSSPRPHGGRSPPGHAAADDR